MLTISRSADNNKGPILEVLQTVFRQPADILEIASGTAQHAVHFAAAMPHLTWRTSDLGECLPDIRARLAEENPGNVIDPVELDVSDHPWPLAQVDGIFAANFVHIAGWSKVEYMFAGVETVLKSGGRLCLYGPYKYGGEFTTISNQQFDSWLKARDPQSGVRDFEAVSALASAIGLALVKDHPMPANNQLLEFRRDR